MEGQPDPDKVHIFLSPDVIETHLKQGLPIQPGLAKLIWVLQQVFDKDEEP